MNLSRIPKDGKGETRVDADLAEHRLKDKLRKQKERSDLKQLHIMNPPPPLSPNSLQTKRCNRRIIVRSYRCSGGSGLSRNRRQLFSRLKKSRTTTALQQRAVSDKKAQHTHIIHTETGVGTDAILDNDLEPEEGHHGIPVRAGPGNDYHQQHRYMSSPASLQRMMTAAGNCTETIAEAPHMIDSLEAKDANQMHGPVASTAEPDLNAVPERPPATQTGPEGAHWAIDEDGRIVIAQSAKETARRSGRVTEAAQKRARLATIHTLIRAGCRKGLKKFRSEGKGYGVKTIKRFKKRNFVVEYCGKLQCRSAAVETETKYKQDPTIGSYMYFFDHKGHRYCLDATFDGLGTLGRLVNHSRLSPNCKASVVDVDGVPRLVIFAIRNIAIGEEILYDYGDKSKEALEANPWLENS